MPQSRPLTHEFLGFWSSVGLAIVTAGRPGGSRRRPGSRRAPPGATIGQWPESMSTNSTVVAAANSGTSPAAIHPRASDGVNSGHTSTTGTSYRRWSVSQMVPCVTVSGTGTTCADNSARWCWSRSEASGPSKRSQPGERDQAVDGREGLEVAVTVGVREPSNQHDSLHSVRPPVGRRPGEGA